MRPESALVQETSSAEPTAAEIIEWDRRHHWHSFTQMAEYEPLVVERAEGVWLIDAQGRRILDGVSSLWCNLHGHNHPKLNAAIHAQLDRVAHTTSLGMGNRPAAVLARRLAELAPGDLEHVFFCGDGSSAVEAALKMAFQYWRQCDEPQPQKTKYLALNQAYHGDTLGSASVGGIERFHALFKPLLFDVVRLPTPDAHRLPPGVDSSQATRHYLVELETALAEHHEQLAAVVIEPRVQAAAGMVFHPEGYLRGVRELTRRYNVLLIADEVVTAFCRTGPLFACQAEDVAPDLLCLGKGITGGYLPLSATLATPEIYRAFLGTAASGRIFHHGHTYGANPLASAVALASLELLLEDSTQQHVAARTQQLGELLESLATQPHVAGVRQRGMLAAVELVSHPAEARIGHRIYQECLRRGAWLRPLGDTLVVMPPLAISEAELELLMSVLCESIVAVA